MAEFHLSTEGHERSYLIGELKSLGLSTLRISRLAEDGIDNNELRRLIQTTKDNLLWEFHDAHK